MSVWRMRFEFLITKATNTRSEYAVLIDFHWLRFRALMLRLYVHILSS